MNIEKAYQYNDAYQKENIQRVVVKFNKKSERDQKILDHLYRQRNEDGGKSVQEYIKQAIEAKMDE